VHDRRETVPTREGGQYRLRYRVLAYGAVNRLGGVERTYWSPENLDTTKLFQIFFWARKVPMVFCCNSHCEDNIYLLKSAAFKMTSDIAERWQGHFEVI
jgi:hypothetical protein